MMSYKDTLLFIAKCLTITLEEKNRKEIEKQLKTNNIDWDAVVKLSTGHYVFPALYCNLKRVNFLKYLPTDLVEYMIYFTDLNRERNTQIIAQAKEINELLLENKIIPVFIKGTGNLLEGLYEDIAERMLGDIDLILNKRDAKKADEILRDHKYSSNSVVPDNFRHLPSLTKLNKIAAIEIHTELLIEEYRDEFNYVLIEKDVQKINHAHVMGFESQLALSILANQINNDHFKYKDIFLRNAYDVFVLSKKTNTKTAFNKFNKLKHPLNCFLAICFEVFNKPKSLEYNDTLKVTKHLNTFNKKLNNPTLRKTINQGIEGKIRFSILYKSIFDKEIRTWLIKRITDKQWQKEKLIQLGLKT